ncbi:MAG: DUF1800 family protein [Planctomycetota bacterium]
MRSSDARALRGLAWIAVCLAVWPVMVAAETAVSPYAESLQVWSHQRNVIPFRIEAAPTDDLVIEAESDNPEALNVLGPARVLPGHTIGFVRVETNQPGVATLTIGDRAIDVQVAASASASLLEARRPRIVTPVSGAAVWDGFSVSVEVFDEFGQLSEAGEEITLILPDGSELQSVSASRLDRGPHRRFSFEVEAGKLEPGSQMLVAEVRGVPGIPSRSLPVHVGVYDRASVEFLVDREAEAEPKQARPRRAGGQRPLPVVEDQAASGGYFVNQNSGNRSFAAAVPVGKDGGWFAVRVRAGGDEVNALPPSIGVFMDAENRAKTIGVVADTGWHHAAIGRPFWLDAPKEDERVDEVNAQDGGDAQPSYEWPDGHRVLTLRLENDYSAGRNVDRNLALDYVEIVRLPHAPPAPDAVYDCAALTADEVRGPFVGLDPALNGINLAGPRRIQGFVGGIKLRNLAETQLLLNGEPVATTRDTRPVFWITPSQGQPGVNEIQLAATDRTTGRRYVSATHRVTIDPALAEAPPRLIEHFAIRDRAWAKPNGGKLERQDRIQRRQVVAFKSHGHIDLRLPETSQGPTRIELHGFGDLYDGKPIAEVSWLDGDKTKDARVLGQVDFNGWPDTRQLGVVDIPSEATALRIAFVNDKYNPESKRDRNLYLTGITLWPIADAPAETSVALAYPSNGETLGFADAMAAEVRSEVRVTWAEAVIDGVPTGNRFRVEPGAARVLVPLALRPLAQDGDTPLTLALRVGDEGETLGQSETVSVTVSNHPQASTTYAQAVAFLNRVAFGPEPEALADVLIEGRTAWLDRMLTAGWQNQSGLRDAWLYASIDRQNEESRGNLNQRAAGHLLRTPNPVRGRLAMFVDNHFTTWWRKASPQFRVEEHARWLELGAAPFHELLFASATSPAMLRYLDQRRSFANRLNENYAREIMELHTVGVHGGYTQADVTALAKLLTGWQFDETARLDAFGRLKQATFRHLSQRNLPDAQRIFGYAFPEAPELDARYDRARTAVELLASHPSTAGYISEKLVGHYAGLPADDTLAAAAEHAFHATGGDLRDVVRAIVLHPEFLDKAEARRLAHPVGFAVRLQRLAGTAKSYAVVDYTNQSGFGLFDRDTPDGYPEEDDAYADTNATLQRWRYADAVSGDLIRRLPNGLAYRNSFPNDDEKAAWQQSLIDHLAIFITGDLLGETSNAAALDILRSTELTGWERNRLMAQFVAQLPESALR